jgi:signal peptidase II
LRRLVAIAILTAALDQLTKLLVLRWVDPEYPVVVIASCFRLVNWGNTGAAWGMFQDSNTILIIVSLLTAVALYFFRHSFQIHRRGNQIAFGLIGGGIVGNCIDRLRHGHVVDFLDFYINNHHWPAFNVADSGICVGVTLYIIISWRTERRVHSA